MQWLSVVNGNAHGTTHQIPGELLAMEKLNHVDRAPEYFTRKEETHKVSRDCYVSWNGNRYSVPWIYTGRETLVPEKFTLKIQVDSQIIAEHDILPGTGRISSRSIVGLYSSICRSCRHGCGSRCTNCYWSGNRFRWSNSHFLD